MSVPRVRRFPYRPYVGAKRAGIQPMSLGRAVTWTPLDLGSPMSSYTAAAYVSVFTDLDNRYPPPISQGEPSNDP